MQLIDPKIQQEMDMPEWESHYKEGLSQFKYEDFREYDASDPYYSRMLKYSQDKSQSLEFGSGKGGLSLTIKHSNPQINVHLLDFSQKALEFSQGLFDYYGHEVCTTCGSFLELPFKSESFDFIHGNTVFEHVTDPMQAARELTRVLKKEGIILLTVPNSYRAFDGSDLYHYIFEHKYYSGTFYPQELEELFAHCSCEILERFGTTIVYHFPWYLPRFIQMKAEEFFDFDSKEVFERWISHRTDSRRTLRILGKIVARLGYYSARMKETYYTSVHPRWARHQLKLNRYVSNNRVFPPSWYITIGIVARKIG